MPVVVWKQIKPNTLKVKAMQDALLKEMSKVGKDIKKDFEKTTATWKTDVDFEILQDLNPNGPEVLVSTDNPIYRYVDKGTRVRRALMTSGFSPKTKPNIIGSTGGSGGLLFVSKKLERPGIQARNFSKNIQKKWQPIFKRRMETAMKKVRQVSGQAI